MSFFYTISVLLVFLISLYNSFSRIDYFFVPVLKDRHHCRFYSSFLSYNIYIIIQILLLSVSLFILIILSILISILSLFLLFTEFSRRHCSENTCLQDNGGEYTEISTNSCFCCWAFDEHCTNCVKTRAESMKGRTIHLEPDKTS